MEWELPHSLTHHPLTNIIECFSDSSCASVKTVRGCFAHVISTAPEAADENVGRALFFLLASPERSRSSALKNHTTSPELLIDTQAALFFQEKADLRGFEAGPSKVPHSLLISSPPTPLQNAMYCNKSLTKCIFSPYLHCLKYPNVRSEP